MKCPLCHQQMEKRGIGISDVCYPCAIAYYDYHTPRWSCYYRHDDNDPLKRIVVEEAIKESWPGVRVDWIRGREWFEKHQLL